MTSTDLTIRLLIVDDQPLVTQALLRMLSSENDFVIRIVNHGNLACSEALEFRPTVILQDIVMPGIGGVELIRDYREALPLMDVPIIVLSGVDDAEKKRECFETGANDYLLKLPDKVELLARLRYHSSSYRKGVERDNAYHLLMLSQKQLVVANFELQKLTGLDGLTGIANRREFERRFNTESSRAMRSGEPLSLLMCDVDHFKSINDGFGHVTGDRCLRTVALGIAECLRSNDLVARFGGEEFIVLLADTDEVGSQVIAERCRQAVQDCELVSDAGAPLSLTMSIGAATAQGNAAGHYGDLISNADRALYYAKQAGRNRVAVFDPSLF